MGKKGKIKIPKPADIVKKQFLGPTGILGHTLSGKAMQAMGIGGGGGGGMNLPGETTLQDLEARSGVKAPQYESLRDPTTGQLKDLYKYDPTKSEAFSQIRSQALSSAPSAWANMQVQRQQLEQQNLADDAVKQQMQAINQARTGLARTGGLSSGAGLSLARQGARDMMLQKQGISRQGMLDRLGVSQTDEERRQGLLKGVADAETRAQQANLATLTGDMASQRDFDLNRYREQMGAWGAQNTSAAQAAAGQATRRGKK